MSLLELPDSSEPLPSVEDDSFGLLLRAAQTGSGEAAAELIEQFRPYLQQLFIDGHLIANNNGPGGNMGLGGAITLGRANSGGSFIGGSLDEFRIYSRCLTDKEISQLSKWRR